jgi:hypothetical protein
MFSYIYHSIIQIHMPYDDMISLEHILSSSLLILKKNHAMASAVDIIMSSIKFWHKRSENMIVTNQGRSRDLRVGGAMKKIELTFMSHDFSYI